MFLICFVSNNYGIYFVNIPKFVTNKRFMLDEEVPAKYASKFAIPTYVVYFHTFNLIFSLMNDLV